MVAKADDRSGDGSFREERSSRAGSRGRRRDARIALTGQVEALRYNARR